MKNKTKFKIFLFAAILITFILTLEFNNRKNRAIRPQNQTKFLDSHSIKYSLFDRSQIPGTEDPQIDRSLPQFTTTKGEPWGRYLSRSRTMTYKNWNRSNGDAFSSKYSSLNQINQNNVRRLKHAWTYYSGEGNWKGKPLHIDSEMNPVMAGDKLFVVTPSGALVALNPQTGEEIWRRRFESAPARRGLIWWPGNANYKPRIFIPAGKYLYSVNPENGLNIDAFGEKGAVRLNDVSLTAPAYIGTHIFATTMAPDVESFDIENGSFNWARGLISSDPKSKLFKKDFDTGANPWAGFSVDESRSALFITTGNPHHNLHGAGRPGKNRHSDSILSINSETGIINWSFQEVSHDIWDLDIPSAPLLTSVRINNKIIDVVAAVTKMGNTLLLSRDTGKPIFDFRMERVPASTVPGEITERYQPSLEIPEPFLKRYFEPSDVTNIGAENRAHVENTIRHTASGYFVPPSFLNNTIQYGIVGGAEWPGAAVNQKTGVLYVPTEQIPVLYRLYYLDSSPKNIEQLNIYTNSCLRCHGQNREGQYNLLSDSWEMQRKNITTDEVAPSLVGITALREQKVLLDISYFKDRHIGIRSLTEIGSTELKKLYEYFSELDQYTDKMRGFLMAYRWWNLTDHLGYPGSRPPWGTITAINLNTGKKIWRKPFGEYDLLTKKGVPITGQHNLGGLIVTEGGLIFATGTLDKKIRAISSVDGRELWNYRLPAVGSSPPTTYEYKGTQYLAVIAHGGRYPNYDDHSDAIIAFKIPK